jgi:NAD(P)-dependent dehydrogenase (short-subunit alcohol dehydrogenase family)
MERIAIVTGGGSGIGRASALALAQSGWQVTIAGRRAGPLDAVRAGSEGRIACAVADVTSEESVRALFAGVAARFGRIDLLFNNAGAMAPPAPVAEVTLESWQAVQAANVTGAFLCAREAFRHMAAQTPRGGRIINNGSLSAQVPRPLSIAYTVSKHAITGLTRALALEGRAHGIACGQIDIGNAATELTAGIAAGARQADGSIAAEPTMDVANVAASVVHMASLPLDANVAFMTVMATAMPFVGRG